MSETRDELRAKIFAAANTQPKIVPLTFFGADLELRQPKMRDILKAQANEDRESAVIQMLTDYAYIPGTEERAFEEGDAENLKNLPFGKDFQVLSKALEDLTEVNFLDKKPSSTVVPTTT